MLVDASVVVAILGREPDWGELIERLEAAATIVVSPIVVYESALAVARIRQVSIDIAHRSVDKFLVSVGAEIMRIDAAIGAAAIAAFTRFGKSRQARLAAALQRRRFPADRRPSRLTCSI